MKMFMFLLAMVFAANLITGVLSFDLYATLDKASRDPLPEENMNVSQMITYNGYPVENHEVTTEDGYILSIQHIPHGRQDRYKDVPSKKVVFLQHGLLASATNWVTNLPNQSFAFILADQGFDVWLGNMRGNTYCRRHVKYPVDSDEFWDFSFDEMAKYDLPAMINYVTNITGQPTLYYVGHSQGTMIGFIGFGRNPELIKKVETFYALAPVSTVTYMGGALKYLSYLAPELEFLFKIFGVREFLPSDFLIKWFAKRVCQSSTVLEMACSDFLFLIGGYDKKQLNEVSWTDSFCFVIGTPPEYNVSSLAVPTFIYWAENDVLADPKDVKSLMAKLPHKIYLGNKYIKEWEHLDFVWGMDAATEVYQDIIKRIKEKN
ncbi:gastric triacylglycerol lipase-like [Actinia tenebrosa]|uniref:Lipase n=1 Tax=Actinia tenebrosa TaxID=6105 RepID=A0A6P8IGT6_ACTTE|nr:gastric triacylglycerol lipase-like [Actinia tenebrosa]